MAKKNGFVLTGSVQEKNGKLYLVSTNPFFFAINLPPFQVFLW